MARNLADAGATLIQLRDKKSTARQFYSLAKEMSAQLPPLGVHFIVNDRADIAAMVGAAGVHVGQDDLPVEDARKICQPPSWVGISTHNVEQFRQAGATSADYIAVGPIFQTATKENPDPVVGFDLLRQVRKLTTKPIVAIGGIKLENAADVYRAGADSLAVIGDLAFAPDPAKRVAEYLSLAHKTLPGRS